ncbi:Signal peptide peptidase SppA, 36K type [uncultured Pleomorphomonas sp.]|uniref:Signal peptide peptidase SppA, 36K type n=1 Tax=uncultured Pleomorphomonas sp. TaxID=442121 RepID=A0A212LJQ0_9HYPH|nr:signal peptide peptidase SppA [uncultured Pleomorphomonas sp.]SCM77775.1 Signal peptide peptidase SppA, 36K type [uncultured Pleomorphomonas sp.]
MTLEADAIVERRRLKRRLYFWRGITLLLAVGVAVAFGLYVGGGMSSKSAPHIARVTVSGMILSDAGQRKMLKDIASSDAVKAVIVAIDSPGGTTVGGEELYDGLRGIAAKKPVVATMGTLATSAGYMTAIATDRIFAERTSITGSIGVLFQYGNVGALMQNIGVEVKTIKSAPLKAEPSPFTYPEQPGAAAMIQRLVDDTYAWFVDIVAERRSLARPDALKLADGSVYSGRQALDLRLVDEIGGEDEAVTWLEGAKGIGKDLKVVDWAPERPYAGFGIADRAMAAAGRLIGIDLSAWNSEGRLDGLVSVWHP